MKKMVCIFAILFFAGMMGVQAQRVVSGKVTSSDDGSPLPGVSVVVKGTTLGTVTNMDGNYSLQVPQNAQALMYSFVGYRTHEAAIETRSQINVVLELDVIGVDEVVVTALGITRQKKALGYASQDISSEEVARANNPNLLTSLSGKIAGVEVRQSSGMPGAPATVLIRGARSFSGNNQPLYVVDGMPIASNPDYGQDVTGSYYSARALDLDPNDIESVNVLKGQAAAALYGLRASNGVIVITTKSGKNTAKGNPTVNITSSYTADVIARYPDVQMTYAQGSYGSFTPANSYSWGPKITDLPANTTYGGNNQGQSGLWWDPYKAKWVKPEAFNNAKNFFDTGSSWYNGVNISNSTANASYLIGLSSTDQSGVVPNTGMNRYTAKLNATTSLGRFFKAGFSGNFSDVRLKKLPSGNSSNLPSVFGAPPSYDLMGTPYYMEGPLGKYRQISWRRGSFGENMRWAAENNLFAETTRRFFGNTYLEFTPASWVTLKYQIGVDTYATDNEDIYQAGSAATGQLLPTAAQYTTPARPTFAYVAPTGGSINNYGFNRRDFNSLLNITFTKEITPDLKAILNLGNDFNDYTGRSWTMTGTGFTVPGWNNMSNTTKQTADESKGRSRQIGTYGDLSLDYKGMLFFNATGRYDIVSSMPRGARSFFYPSVSLGFVFTELPALKENAVLSFGKLRGSFAQVGQAGTYNELYYVMGGAGSGFLNDGIAFPLGGVSGFRPNSTLYDPELKPQNTTNWEAGIELKFLRNRLGIDYTYSDQTATDQIFAVPMAGSTGYSSFVTNAGEMNSIAHEVVLNLIPMQYKDFEWNINANFTRVVNKVISLAEGIESVHLAGYVTPNVRAYAGQTYPTIYGWQLERDDKGNVVIEDDPDAWNYGFPTENGTDGKIGDVSPDFIVGANTNIRYKFVTLSAQFDWKQGGDIYSGTNRLIGLYGSAQFTEEREGTFSYGDTENAKGKGVLSNGSPNNIVRGGKDDPDAWQDFYTGSYSSIDEMAVYETSYVKLREVALTIDLPKKLLTPVKMQRASLSLIGRNFLLWTTLPNVDPESSQGMGNGQMGFEYMSLPQTTSYGVTLNLTF